MVDRLKKYGVEIEQIFATTPPEPTVPQLIPCIVGPCFEVLESVSADGSVNDSARFMNSYLQQPMTIPLVDLPAPRGNARTLDFVESEISADLLVGGNFKRLSRTEAFLGSVNVATRAALIWKMNSWASINNKHLVIAFDQTVPGNATKDITINITTAANEGAVEIVDLINAAVGEEVAFKLHGDQGILLASTTYGAASSVTIRKWGDNVALNIPNLNIRIEASGFRVQDDEDGDTVSPWIEYFVGNYLEDADNGITVEAEWNVNAGITPCLLPVTAVIDTSTKTLSGHLLTIQTAKDWTGGSATLPLQAASPIRSGDVLVADGVVPGNAQIIKVELNRFKLGVVDSDNSTYDSEGNPLNQVYKAYELGTMLNSVPFAPVSVYFRARGLTGSEVNEAATLTGSRAGSTPTAASVVTDATDIPTLVGQYLVFSVIEDGVEGDDEILTWTGSYSNRTEMQADFEALKAAQGVLSNVICTVGAGALTFKTVKTGANQSITIRSTGTANAILGISTDTDLSGVGADPLLINSAATTIVIDPINTEAELGALTITAVDSEGLYELVVAHQDAAPGRTIEDLLDLVNAANESADGGSFWTAAIDGDTIVLTAPIGWNRVDAAVNADWGVADTHTISYAEITGSTLVFTLDDNPHEYRVTFASNSLTDAVTDINSVVGGNVASLSDDYKLELTSLMSGICSKVEVIDSGAVDAVDTGALRTRMGTVSAFTFGFSKTAVDIDSTSYTDVSDLGSGRPEPEFSTNTLVQSAEVGGNLIRESVTGTPIDSAGNSIYFSYRGLRKEVSTEVDEPDVIRISNFTDLNSSFGPLDERNPLGLAMFYALVSAGEGIEIKALGVSAVTPEEPEGTLLSYVACNEVLRSHEVYFVLPLSRKKEVIDVFDTHVTDMSKKENRGERVLIACPPNPTRKPDTLILSGVGETTGVVNQFNLKDNPGEMLVTNGVNPNNSIPFELPNTRQLYLEVTVGGQVRHYSVSRVSGGVVTLRSTIPASKNLDGFFCEVLLDDSLSDAEFALKLRGAKVTVLGTNKLDKLTYAETVRDLAQQYANRRQLRLYPDTVTATIGGVSKSLPSYYFAAALIGDACNTIGSTPYSGKAIPGFTGIVAPKLEETQYDIISAGNAVIEQPVRGGNLALRMQATTDMSSIEFREWSITKAVDQFAKIIRNTLKTRTGPFNITKGYMDDTSLMLEAVAKVAVESGLLKSAKLAELIQDPDEKTTVGATFIVEVLYPANYLKITILS